MKITSKLLFVTLLILLAVGANAKSMSAKAEHITVPKGLPVILAFDQDLSSKTAKVGESVALHVKEDVMVNGHIIIPAGKQVSATISQVDKRKRYGINAKMRIVFNPIESNYGGKITLIPRSKGEYIGGSKSGQAAGATAGGAILMGPVGLVGGYFVVGKPVTINAGDELPTEVASAVKLPLPK